MWRKEIIIIKPVSVREFEWTELCRTGAIGRFFTEPQNDRAGVWALVILIGSPPFIDKKLRMKEMR